MGADPFGFTGGLVLAATVGVVADQLLLFVSTLIAGCPPSRCSAVRSLR